jgi:hypothetical protein
MANIFTLENIEDFVDKLNIDDLYEKKRQYDLNQLTLFNKILNRIHVRIKTTSRQKISEQFCWYVIPEIMIGVPKYDQASCIAYIIDKLKSNGFNVKYFHPNTVLISWGHWVPSYVRSELKKKTGIEVNEYGEKINESNQIQPYYDIPQTTNIKNIEPKNKPNKKEYTPIRSYKPTGNLVYDDDILSKIEDKFS